MKNRHIRFLFFICAALVPQLSHAQVSNFVFTSEPQSVEPGVVSQQITLQAQDSGGTSVNIPQTACLSLNTTSAQGQFSSSATNWTPVAVLTMNKNTANKNFFYRDIGEGTQTLSIKIALKPADVSSSCTNWPVEEWNIQWTATQNIIIGSGSSPGNPGSPDSSSATSTAQTQTQTTSSAQTPSYVSPPSPEVFADGGEDRTVIVGADTEFRGRAYDRKQELVGRVRFNWNFGDGSTAEGVSVTHHFDYPGKYAVVLTIAQNISAASDRIIVTAEPAKLGFSVNPDGSVSITNNAGRDIDISRWILRSFGRSFIFPEDTIVLRGETMRIANDRIGFPVGPQTELQYPNGTRAEISGGEPPGPTPPHAVAPQTQTNDAAPKKTALDADEDATGVVVEPEHDAAPAASVADVAPVTATSQVAAAGSVSGSSYLWWLGAFGLALAASGTAFAVRRVSRGEWSIIEEN